MDSLKAVSRVALLREEKGITQLELAQLLGVTENSVANWERGRSGIEWFVRIAKLCQIFQCHPEDLIEYLPVDPQPKNEKESLLEEIRLSLRTTKQAKIIVKSTVPTSVKD